ncbi:hypothetical protein LCM10_17120 [Rossellomorea aquimaris]|uniref:hypothetical protein n=1 Tax=Rossellomorea aquimaris TaxID=189382 RepID=UPI001CD45557|nr:hypothetical protein [Rossellomorea aquimaris]MCA1056707.1 hypothetical protein [Rossellomorea aquimaris]
MGYIAPIPHHQYKQYQEREMKVNQTPFRFMPVQPIKALKNKSGQTDHEQTTSSDALHSGSHRLLNRERKQRALIPSELIAKVTGKGTYFNEYV